MNVADFRELVHEDIEIAVKANSSNPKEEFLLYSTGLLINGDEFDDLIECPYSGITRRNGYMQIDGYSFDDADGSCCVFIVDYHGHDSEDSINAENVNSAFRRIRLFIEEAIRRELFLEIADNDQAADFARDLFYENDNITKFRLYYLTDAYNRQRAKTTKDETILGKTVELNIWDINRLHELVSSSVQKESVEILFSNYGLAGIPCVKAVDYKDIKADIDVIPQFDKDLAHESDKPANILSYQSYLAVIPGTVLNSLYLEYGSRLLEGNVRSFLSARGKVNSNIQNTIKNYPEMFFAYNNGIAATATELDVKMTANGPIITRIKDLQIVNGGQTTASITNTILKAKKNEVIDISRLYVQMKISVLEHSMAERIIPKISEYSNSQNKVEASDFFSNHPFHIRMEEYSRKTAIPSLHGNQFQQYWFYERARGQYNQGKMKFGAKSAQLKQYANRYPENQVITMLDLAKYMEIYACAPYIVSRGKQKMLQVFAEEIKNEWQKSDLSFNVFYFKRVVALAILYHRTDEIIKRSSWYKEKKSYKANVIAYTLSIIFLHVQKYERGMQLDFERIWDNQNIDVELEEQITVLTKEVYDFITGPRDTENVTEWCKKESCWNRARSHIWTFNDSFRDVLISENELGQSTKEGIETRKIENEIDALKEIMARGSDYWYKMLQWGIARKLLSEKEQSILKLITNMNLTGRIPSDKQAKVVLQTRARLIDNGMPMQF